MHVCACYSVLSFLQRQINELRDDICVPDYCSVGGGELRSLNAWFGPAGIVTPLHRDPHHNMVAQVCTFCEIPYRLERRMKRFL